MYKATLTLSSTMVIIEQDVVEIVNAQDGEPPQLTADEYAVVAVVSQAMSRLKNGKIVNYDLLPDSFYDPEQIIKCEWLESGNLKERGPAHITYNFCNTIEECLQCKAVFTCTRKLFSTLPKRRERK